MQEYEYVQVQPTTDGIEFERIAAPFERLHALAKTLDAPFEWLLVSVDGDVGYFVGGPPDGTDELAGVLRSLFPDSYELTAAEPPLDAVLDDSHPDDEAQPDDAADLVSDGRAALVVEGVGELHDDWMTQLTPLAAPESDRSQPPLAAVADTFAERDATAVFQALLDPKGDWGGDAQYRHTQVKHGEDTWGQKVFRFLFGPGDGEPPEPRGDKKRRMEQLEAVDCRQSFATAARLVATGADAERVCRSLRTAFHPASGRFYQLRGTVRTDDADRVADAIRERTIPPEDPGIIPRKVPFASNASEQIIADPATVPNLCVLDGATVPTAAARALDVTHDERSAVPRPAPEQLDRYRKGGITLGCPVTQDGTVDDAIAVPPALQPLHLAIIGKTGSGKSTLGSGGHTANHGATDGASIHFVPKGGGMVRELLQMHYAKYGSLEDVYYFDCTETIPAVSFYDIRPELDSGIDRATAVADVVDHTVEIIRAVMGPKRYDSAVRSPDIIRYLLKALFDPVHGDDAFAHRDLMNAATRLHETRDPPPVVDEDLAQMLGGVAANSKRSFDELMQGVANRIEKIPLDERLATLFNHVPRDPDDPRFDLRDVLDEDCVVIVDTGGLRTESQRVLALVLLSNLWTALRRRARDTDGDAAVPLVNLYLEEAASLATTDLMSDLLAKSREFGLSVTLAMQFPAQLRQAGPAAYAEVLNNVSTIVTGNVPLDRELAERLATADMDANAVAARLRALSRGEWLATLPAGFGEPEPRPFTLESAPLPEGHPESDAPLSDARTAAFEAQYAMITHRSATQHGLPVGRDYAAETEPDTDDAPVDEVATQSARVDSALPYTKRMPGPVRYLEAAHALACKSCDRRHPPTSDGLVDAVECCSTMARVDRDDVPICDVPLTLTPEERAQSEYTDRQLAFLQAVYAAFNGHYDAPHYELREDSMLRLQEYVGVDADAVQELLDDGLLNHDGDRPHRLYTVTAAGRDLLQERLREGVTYGDGAGDLGESARHRVMVLDSADYLRAEYVADPDHAATSVEPYYEVGDRRYDVVALDADGDIVVALEAERRNHDLLDAVPDDFDKLAAADPQDAVWVVESRNAAHDIVRALNDPNDGAPRLEKTYSESMPPTEFQYDTDGLTDVLTHSYARRAID